MLVNQRAAEGRGEELKTLQVQYLKVWDAL